jgi:hypothetical protein
MVNWVVTAKRGGGGVYILGFELCCFEQCVFFVFHSCVSVTAQFRVRSGVVFLWYYGLFLVLVSLLQQLLLEFEYPSISSCLAVGREAKVWEREEPSGTGRC